MEHCECVHQRRATGLDVGPTSAPFARRCDTCSMTSGMSGNFIRSDGGIFAGFFHARPFKASVQQGWYIGPVLFYFWTNVCDAGPESNIEASSVKYYC